jgi:hypothetical protein
MFNDLSLVSPKRGMGYPKKEKEKERKDGMPQKHDPKKKKKYLDT